MLHVCIVPSLQESQNLAHVRLSELLEVMLRRVVVDLQVNS